MVDDENAGVVGGNRSATRGDASIAADAASAAAATDDDRRIPPPFPFDVVVVTSPDAEAARAVRGLVAACCPSSYATAKATTATTAAAEVSDDIDDDGGVDCCAEVVCFAFGDDGGAAGAAAFLSSCDPFGARMGSGGGTIAALAEADEAYRRRPSRGGGGAGVLRQQVQRRSTLELSVPPRRRSRRLATHGGGGGGSSGDGDGDKDGRGEEQSATAAVAAHPPIEAYPRRPARGGGGAGVRRRQVQRRSTLELSVPPRRRSRRRLATHGGGGEGGGGSSDEGEGDENGRSEEQSAAASTAAAASATAAAAAAAAAHLPTVLICHAGGESSRCPTQMVLGKAWTSLPAVVDAAEETKAGPTTADSSTPAASNPTSLLISSLSRAFADVPKGSVVVAASDVLLSLFDDDCDGGDRGGKIDFGGVDPGGVVGLAVPAPLATASNHGVFVLPDGGSGACEKGSGGGWDVRPALEFLQKPSPDEMHSPDRPAPCVFQRGGDGEKISTTAAGGGEVEAEAKAEGGGEALAWIDTGVVAFLPGSAQTLRNLASSGRGGPLRNCTRRGLLESHGENIRAERRRRRDDGGDRPSRPPTGASEFARSTAPRIELYSHLLRALDVSAAAVPAALTPSAGGKVWDGRDGNHIEGRKERDGDGERRRHANRKAAYLREHPGSDDLFGELYDALSGHKLYACAVPRGRFVHLGTTSELLDFLTSGGGRTGAEGGAEEGSKEKDGWVTVGKGGRRGGVKRGGGDAREVGRNRSPVRAVVGLSRRSNAFLTGFAPGDAAGATVLHSVLRAGDDDGDGCGGSVTKSKIGVGSVVEHCDIRCSGGIFVGERCLVSGVRGTPVSTTTIGHDKNNVLRVPSGICLQLLQLRSEGRPPSSEDPSLSFVCICVGVEDRIKDSPPTSFYGVRCRDAGGILQLLRSSGIEASDLWDNDVPESKRSLWNARMHPVLRYAEGDHGNNEDGGEREIDMSFLKWIERLLSPGRRPTTFCDSNDRGRDDYDDDDDEAVALEALRRWKGSERLSLSEIRERADPAAEAASRDRISPEGAERHRLDAISDALLRRTGGTARGFDFAVERVATAIAAGGTTEENGARAVLLRSLSALDGAARVAAAAPGGSMRDVAGRSFAVASLLLSDVSDALLAFGAAGGGAAVSAAAMSESIRELLSSDAGDSNGDAVAAILSIRDGALFPPGMSAPLDPGNFVACAEYLERAARAMTERCVSAGGPTSTATFRHRRVPPAPPGTTVIASAPARIDLSGGWSDTPPISYEHGGAVACLAVLVDGERPLKARCRVVRVRRTGVGGTTGGCGVGGGVLTLRTESRSSDDGSLLSMREVAVRTADDLADFRDPRADCALLKCALIYLGLVPLGSARERGGGDDGGGDRSIRPHLNAFCRGGGGGEVDVVDDCNDDDDYDFGLEITASSRLPTGSGMGTSSILGGCVLAAIARCVGIDLSTAPTSTSHPSSPDDRHLADDSGGGDDADDDLVRAVSSLEQLLTTGGGWQDQVGGLIGGLKLGTSDAGVLPLWTRVRRYELSPEVRTRLNDRLALLYTGRPRLARDILRNVLRRWARRDRDVVETVEGLVRGARDAIARTTSGDLDGLGACMTSYWEMKKAMAGSAAGVEPESVRDLLDRLTSDGTIAGGTLCGAGGGGFLVVLASEGRTAEDVQRAVVGEDDGRCGVDCFTWHKCTVAEKGLIVEVENIRA